MIKFVNLVHNIIFIVPNVLNMSAYFVLVIKEFYPTAIVNFHMYQIQMTLEIAKNVIYILIIILIKKEMESVHMSKNKIKIRGVHMKIFVYI